MVLDALDWFLIFDYIFDYVAVSILKAWRLPNWKNQAILFKLRAMTSDFVS